jgi:hypothetical protein
MVAGLLNRGIDPLDRSGQHDLPGRVEIRHIHRTLGRQRFHRFFLTADHRRHRTPRRLARLFHEQPAPGDQLQPDFERKGPGRRMGGELPERKPGGRHRADPADPLAQQGQRDQTMQIKRRLAARSPRQFLLRAVEHRRRQRKPERLVRLTEQFARRRRSLMEVLAHAHLLGALSGE